jgi:hypothetical protein
VAEGNKASSRGLMIRSGGATWRAYFIGRSVASGPRGSFLALLNFNRAPSWVVAVGEGDFEPRRRRASSVEWAQRVRNLKCLVAYRGVCPLCGGVRGALRCVALRCVALRSMSTLASRNRVRDGL